jgi:DNA-directed RNA polymerase subunit RPC12/RpoP
MNNQEQHEMVLEKTHLSGAEEWHCPVCGRRMLVNWKPKFKKIVLEIGDDYAIHSGGKGGLQVGSVQAKPVDVLEPEDELQSHNEDSRLKPWIQWLDEVDFENLWDNEA